MKMMPVVVALAACKSPMENKRVDKLDFKSFSVAVPAGWNEVTDKEVMKHAAPGGRMVMMLPPPGGFNPSVYVQQLEMSPADHQQLFTANDEFCKGAYQSAMVAATKTKPLSAKAVDLHGLKGCEVNVEDSDPNDAQAARMISISNGKVAVSVVCNHDKKGQPAADAACDAMLNAITLK